MKISYLNDAFFSRLEAMMINFRSDLAGFFGGKHRVNSYGQTVEFADYREYQLGDDISRIDWNLYGRFDKYYLKLFTDERQMHVQIFIDCSASMAHDTAKAEYALSFAAALGFLSVQNMDKVSFKLIKGAKAEDKFGTIVGKNNFFSAIGGLEEIRFEDEAHIADAVTGCAGAGNGEGVTVIISDFFQDHDWKKAIDYLSYKKRQVLLIQVLTPEEADPEYTGKLKLKDCEIPHVADSNFKLKVSYDALEAYGRALREFLDELRGYCVSHNAGFITVTTDKPIETVIFNELLRVGLIDL